MKINLKGTQISITPAISDYLDKKIAGLDKLLGTKDESIFAQIELAKTTQHHKSGDFFRAEINLHTSGKDFYVFAEHEDLYAAIDAMKDEIGREVRSWKDRKVGFVRRGGRKIKDAIRGIYRREE